MNFLEQLLRRENFLVLTDCIVTPPKNEYVPSLPLRMASEGTDVDEKLKYILCFSCAKVRQRNCDHSDEERSFRTQVFGEELLYALKRGYKIRKLMQVDVIPARHEVFTGFIRKLMQDKIRAEKEHDEIKRQLAKLVANSVYGTLGKNPDKTATAISSVSEILKMLCDPRLSVTQITALGDRGIVQFQNKHDFVNSSSDTSLVNAALVTSYARIQLLQILHSIPAKDICYTDTDSVIFVNKKDSPHPFSGNTIHDHVFMCREMRTDESVTLKGSAAEAVVNYDSYKGLVQQLLEEQVNADAMRMQNSVLVETEDHSIKSSAVSIRHHQQI